MRDHECHKCHKSKKCHTKKVCKPVKFCKHVTFKEDVKFEKDVCVEGNLKVDGGIIFDGCLEPVGKLTGIIAKDPECVELECETCVDINCDAVINITSLDVTKIFRREGVLPAPFDGQPECAECPVDPENPCVIPQPPLPNNSVIVGDYVRLTNNSTNGNDSAGPCNFAPGLVVDPSGGYGGTVLKMKCPDRSYASGTGTGGSSSSETFIDISFVDSEIPPGLTLIDLVLHLGWSTEPAYDFLLVSVDNVTIISLDAQGPSMDDPYRRASFPLTVSKDSVITVNYHKDGAAYAGVDSCYFYLTDVAQVKGPDPTKLILYRGEDVVFNYTNILDLDEQGRTKYSLSCGELELQTGDQLCLTVDGIAYENFSIDYEIINQVIVDEVYQEIEHKAPLITNELTYNYLPPNQESQLGGFYESDDFVYSISFIEETCEGLIIKSFDVFSSGPYFLNNAFIPDVPVLWPRIALNLYQRAEGIIYRFFPETGELLLNYVEDPDQLLNIGSNGVRFRPVGNPDSRYWQYEHDLKNFEQIFNSPIHFFNFIQNYYKAGFLSQFVDRSELISKDLNPLELDMTQIKRSFGGLTRNEYDDLVRNITDFGILRKYGISRFIYWPYPDSAERKEELLWQVNQNRYGYLAFVPSLENEGGSNFPKLMPGETVTMRNTGIILGEGQPFETSLDDYPLILAMDGFHTGPKPGPDFMQTADYYDINDEWALYTSRLPMIINETNDTIHTNDFGGGVFPPFKFTHGIWYMNDLLDMLLDAILIPRTIGCFLDVGNFRLFGDGFGRFLAENNILDLFCATNTYGPDHPEYPSSFFGPNGLDVGYVFGETNVILGGTDIFFNINNTEIDRFGPNYEKVFKNPTYKFHTPLTDAQLTTLCENKDVATVEALHGPVTNDMTYEKLVACINELSMGKSTEDHSVITPWMQKSIDGLYELIPNLKILIEKLNNIEIDPTVSYSSPYSQTSTDADIFGTALYAIRMGIAGTGHPGEFSEMYTSGFYRSLTQFTDSGQGRLEWIVPQHKFFYPEPTIVPGTGGDEDLGGRQVEIPIINYVDSPKWIISTKFSDPETYPAYSVLGGDAPGYGFADFTTNSFVDGPTNPAAVAGDWVVGVLKESKVKSILGLPENTPSEDVPVFGYITHYFSSWSSDPDSDPTLLPWYPTPAGSTTIAGAATVLTYFNDLAKGKGRLGVDHIIVDQRNTAGGGTNFWEALVNLSGDDRWFSRNGITKIMPLDPNSVGTYYDTMNINKKEMDEGVFPGTLNPTACNPSDYADPAFGLDGAFWNGEIVGHQANLVWLTNATTFSATQEDYMSVKGTSLNKETFEGDFGKDTQMLAYGVYYRPFSTGGTYTSYINWWTVGRKGTEVIKQGLMFGIDRSEGFRHGYVDKAAPYDPNYDPEVNQGIVKASDQDFEKLQQPNIKWDMNANVFFQDIAFTLDAPVGSIDPVSDGEPWICKRYDDVNFCEPLTFRDTILEKCVTMADDPNVNDHLYQDDGYGYVHDPPCP